jgi:transcriptional regulator with XRE-family HTH domain
MFFAGNGLYFMALSENHPPVRISRKTSKLAGETWKNTEFAARLRSRREFLRFSQENLASLVSVSNTTIQNYEAGQYPKGEHAIALARVLDCSLDWLLLGESSPVAEAPEPETAALKAKVAALEADNRCLRELLENQKETLSLYRELRGNMGPTTTDAPASVPNAHMIDPLSDFDFDAM